MKVSIGKNNMWICYTLENWSLLCYFSTVAIKFLFYNSSGYSFQVGLKGGKIEVMETSWKAIVVFLPFEMDSLM